MMNLEEKEFVQELFERVAKLEKRIETLERNEGFIETLLQPPAKTAEAANGN